MEMFFSSPIDACLIVLLVAGLIMVLHGFGIKIPALGDIIEGYGSRQNRILAGIACVVVALSCLIRVQLPPVQSSFPNYYFVVSNPDSNDFKDRSPLTIIPTGNRVEIPFRTRGLKQLAVSFWAASYCAGNPGPAVELMVDQKVVQAFPLTTKVDWKAVADWRNNQVISSAFTSYQTTLNVEQKIATGAICIAAGEHANVVLNLQITGYYTNMRFVHFLYRKLKTIIR